jgi:hypothetical protein
VIRPQRPFTLVRIAAEAEVVRLRALANRTALRAVLAAIALLFLLGALVFAHVAAWFWLDRPAVASAGILGGTDLLLAIIFGGLALRSAQSAVELGAINIRRQALQGIASQTALARLLISVVRLLGRGRPRTRG